MPKRNPWLPYLTIAGVLVLLWGYTQWRDRKYEVQIKPMFSFKPEAVTCIKIAKENVSVTMIKKDTLWTFAQPDTGMPEKYKIDEFFKDVLKGEREGTITDDTAHYSKYGISDGESTQVVLTGDEGFLEKIYIGRSESDYTQEYLRYENDPNVYPARQRLINRLGAVASWWR